jgi:hypothetical protein
MWGETSPPLAVKLNEREQTNRTVAATAAADHGGDRFHGRDAGGADDLDAPASVFTHVARAEDQERDFRRADY